MDAIDDICQGMIAAGGITESMIRVGVPWRIDWPSVYWQPQLKSQNHE